jgi:hypothetical protein
MAQPKLIEAPFISETLDWIDITERYRYEWVCLVEIQPGDNGLEIGWARVVGHGRTRQAALDQAQLFRTAEDDLAPFLARPFVPLGREAPWDWIDVPEPHEWPTLSEPLTWAQICDRYPDEWVTLIDFEDPDDHGCTNFEFRTARVASHHKNRRLSSIMASPYRGRPGLSAHSFARRGRCP